MAPCAVYSTEGKRDNLSSVKYLNRKLEVSGDGRLVHPGVSFHQSIPTVPRGYQSAILVLVLLGVFSLLPQASHCSCTASQTIPEESAQHKKTCVVYTGRGQ